MSAIRLRPPSQRGQTLVEFALIFPVFALVLFGMLIVGIGLFYQQQVANAAREAARYAVIHSATSDCPVGGWMAPIHPLPEEAGEWNCDAPSTGWPRMTGYARSYVFGFPASELRLAACWSGYQDVVTGQPDAGRVNASTSVDNTWIDCTIGGVDPVVSTDSLPCPAATVNGDDTASNLAVSPGLSGAEATNRVTVYACYTWRPPVAGFLGIADTIVLRAVVTEGLQHQR